MIAQAGARGRPSHLVSKGRIIALPCVALPNHFPNGHHFRRFASDAETAAAGAGESSDGVCADGSSLTPSASAGGVLAVARMTSEGAGSM